jgi:hypothetical protein
MTSAAPDVRAPLRLRLAASPGSATLDGAWWPQSSKLSDELADLVDNFPAQAGRVIHAVYSKPGWHPVGRRLSVADRTIKVGSFPGDDSPRILLRLADKQILQLLVVPHDYPPAAAATAMTAASSARNAESARVLIDRCLKLPSANGSSAHGDDDGGAGPHRPGSTARPAT